MNKIETISHHNKIFEIRALPFEDGWRAAVFVQQKRVSPNFFITHENDLDCIFYVGERGLESLFRIIKQEIVEGRIS